MDKICGKCKNFKTVKIYTSKDSKFECTEGICNYLGNDILINYFEPACSNNFIEKENNNN